MARIGFIGASGLMGHGMAKNLLAKGHALAYTVHRNRERVADLAAAGAVEQPSAAALAKASEIVFLCVTGSPQVEAAIVGPDGLLAGAAKGRRPRHRRLLDQRAGFDRAAARGLRRGRSDPGRCAAGAHPGRGRGGQAQRHGRRRAGAVRPPRAGAAHVRRERVPRRRAGRRAHDQAAQQLHRPGDLHRDRRGLRGRRAAPASTCASWSP